MSYVYEMIAVPKPGIKLEDVKDLPMKRWKPLSPSQSERFNTNTHQIIYLDVGLLDLAPWRFALDVDNPVRDGDKTYWKYVREKSKSDVWIRRMLAGTVVPQFV